MNLTRADWASALDDGDLLGLTCAECDRTVGVPLAVCPDCGGRDLERVRLPSEGTVYTETTVAVAPEGFEAPYQVGLVDLDGVRVIARLVGDVDIEDSVAFSDVVTGEMGPAPVFAALD